MPSVIATDSTRCFSINSEYLPGDTRVRHVDVTVHFGGIPEAAASAAMLEKAACHLRAVVLALVAHAMIPEAIREGGSAICSRRSPDSCVRCISLCLRPLRRIRSIPFASIMAEKQFGRFWSEAEIGRPVELTTSVEND